MIMTEPISLREAERRAFKTRFDDGLWDVLLGCFFLLFAVAPLLSSTLGDFWSSAVFVPFWGVIALVIWLLKRSVVRPRLGSVTFGRARKARLTRFTLVMLAANVIAFVLGLAAAFAVGRVPGQVTSIGLGLIFLIFLSLAAYYLDFGRLYFYGFLVGLSPLVGEWLWNQGKVIHHGFPLTFGISAGIMILVGVGVFVRLLGSNPLPGEEDPVERS
jgi:hypothetical protein